MGLDVTISTDLGQSIYSDSDVRHKPDLENLPSLSRTFCHLLGRGEVVSGVPELDQIGRLAGVDIGPLYKMQNSGYGEEEFVEFLLEEAESEVVRESILASVEARKSKIANNIDLVLSTLTLLIERLSTVTNLPDLLDDNGNDLLENHTYFSDFLIDKGDGYIGNNFGQDLRNFKRFVQYAKERGAKTVYFSFG
jgi:hypothetical protein